MNSQKPLLLIFILLLLSCSGTFFNNSINAYTTDLYHTRHKFFEKKVVHRAITAKDVQQFINSGGPLYNSAEAVVDHLSESLKKLSRKKNREIISRLRNVQKSMGITFKNRATVKHFGKSLKRLGDKIKALDLLDKAGFLGGLAGAWYGGDSIGGGQEAINTLIAGMGASGGTMLGAVLLTNPVGIAIVGIVGSLGASIAYDRYGKPFVDYNADKLTEKTREWESNAKKAKTIYRRESINKEKRERFEKIRKQQEEERKKKIKEESKKEDVESKEMPQKKSKSTWKELQKKEKEKAEKAKKKADEEARKKSAFEEVKKREEVRKIAEEKARKKDLAEEVKKKEKAEKARRAAEEKARKKADAEAQEAHEKNLRELSDAVQSGMMSAIKSQLKTAIDSADTQEERDHLRGIVKNIKEALKQDARENQAAMSSAIQRGQAEQRRSSEQWRAVSDAIMGVLIQYQGRSVGSTGSSDPGLDSVGNSLQPSSSVGSKIGSRPSVGTNRNSGKNSATCQRLSSQLTQNGRQTESVSRRYMSSGQAALASEINRLRVEQRNIIRKMKSARCPGISSIP